MSAIGGKRTCVFALQMSAYDPKADICFALAARLASSMNIRGVELGLSMSLWLVCITDQMLAAPGSDIFGVKKQQ